MTLVLGAGAFGSALAVALAANGPVTLWGRRLDWADARENPLLPGVVLPDTITLTESLPAPGSAPVLLAVPMQALGRFLADHAARLDGSQLVLCCKGIDLATLRGPSALVETHCPAATPAVLTGPSFAADIARGLPTALTLACASDAEGALLQAQLSTPTLRLYRTADVAGAELGGALKNVIAIAAGIVMGAGLGDSARAALMTRGYAEMVRLAARLGARAETLAGLSGLGDLVLTCTSAQSRNFRHGLALGQGTPPDASATVEGLATARAVLARASALDMAAEVPVTQMVVAVTTGQIGIAEAVQTLMTRPLKEE
ncbi:NAD(P)H-dependent glycerol-3-phosphate dehydrogenase [Gemmobacter nectariphilus]|uniref:NAD(P)H-dependent glycerol-3-phosphate dehydrogenase n=1 Tax=Gemmobacter nectariphilus TaxID=220343 RepID=UPI0004200DD1|nr:NAD(P)H-dependent glycerol-3-phosphate dehydrogenase [Gemmobacter nectariphilus]